MTDNASKIKAALAKLDVTADVHWTKEGMPSLALVNAFGSGKFTREEVEAAFPGFRRDNLTGTASDSKVNPEAGKEVVDVTVHSNTAEGTTLEVTSEGGNTTTVSTQPPEVAAAQSQELSETGEVDTASQDAIAERLKAKQDELEEFDQELNKAAQRRAAITAQIDELILQQANGGNDKLNDVNSAYFARREQDLQSKAQRLNDLRQAGVTQRVLNEIVPSPAPIDKAMKGRRQ